MSLDDDLARWEAGYLSREELIASYASNEKNLAEPFEKNLDKNLEKKLERNLDKNLVPELALAWPLTACTVTLACRRKSADTAQKSSAMIIKNHTARRGNFQSAAPDPPLSSTSSTTRCNRPDVVPATISRAPKRGIRGVGLGRKNNTLHEIAAAITVCTLPRGSRLMHSQPAAPTRTHDVTLRNIQAVFSICEEVRVLSVRCRNSAAIPVTPTLTSEPTL